jgi:imidazolonepropionase-like amidohydrolase
MAVEVMISGVMKTVVFVVSLVFVFCPIWAAPQSQPAVPQAYAIVVKTDKLLDVRSGRYIEDAAIWIEGERIKEVGHSSEVQSHAPRNAKVIDLGQAKVLLGLIDCQTHIMARMADNDDGYTLALATKSRAFGALEGAFNARLTLDAGFTAIHDVENKGSGYADVALRDAIEQGLAEGPRMEVATRGIAAVGQYEPFGMAADLANFPTGAQMISGVEEARRAVREQIGHVADLIALRSWRFS